MYGDEESTENKMTPEEQRLVLIRKEAKSIADTNEAIHAKVPAMNDAPAQVRIAVFGTEMPSMDASYDEWLRYCIVAVARTPARSKDMAWELKRTFIDLVGRRSSYGREDKERLIAFAFRISTDTSVSDPTISGGMTGVGALVTTERRESLNQTVKQFPIAQNSPGLIEGLRNIVSGKRAQ